MNRGDFRVAVCGFCLRFLSTGAFNGEGGAELEADDVEDVGDPSLVMVIVAAGGGSREEDWCSA